MNKEKKEKKEEKERSKLSQITAEIAHDLGIDKKLVKQVLILLFKEVAIILILKGNPVMIRRFVKFVIAIKGIRKLKRKLNELKTKIK